ncbi:Uncharacterized protein ALO80_02974 [Pseudomonas caricapapayae]|uniref:DUF6957 family protein n=1 Tax=Pseudomonas caricapapayae TaxID=46678 RepID=UPI0006D61E27|nr:hypothetical protein [Pseudomonas caricapapayae]KAA8696562.1 hypothetical protein F4W67_05480 [Pseudomonas caricapapayae]KPW55555.1 Uncharacterized protein ALO80_02974 [Pseudomonas caricapapayae]
MDEVKARLSGPARHLQGVQIETRDAVQQLKDRFPGRSHCVVSDWVWLDLKAPEEVLQGIRDQGQEPVMILGFKVLYDSLDQDIDTSWVRTQPMVEFVDSKFFVTRNTVYFLVGDGQRRLMELSTVLRVFRSVGMPG